MLGGDLDFIWIVIFGEEENFYNSKLLLCGSKQGGNELREGPV